MVTTWALRTTNSPRGESCPAIRSAVHNRVACLESVAQAARLIEPSAVIASRNPRRLNVVSLFMNRLLRLALHEVLVSQIGFFLSSMRSWKAMAGLMETGYFCQALKRKTERH